MTRFEAELWRVSPGADPGVFETPWGRIGIAICYDLEFPPLVRAQVEAGAWLILAPSCTDGIAGFNRVRLSARARALENQCYVVMSGNVGNLPRVHNMDIQYAQSCILTPCDFPFARDGIAADTTPNVETVALADLRMESVRMARNSGTVQNLKDRRHELYRVQWMKD